MIRVYIIILFYSISIAGCLDSYKCKDNKDCLSLYSCDLETNICIHKDFLPISSYEWIGIGLMALVSCVATSVGIGGGLVYSTVLMTISNFPVKIAFPLANFIIFFCSIITFGLGARDKELYPEQEFVDYNLSLIFCPSLLLGTKLGVILNNILPNVLLLLIVMILLLYSAMKAYNNGISTREKEQKEEQSKRFINLDKIYDNKTDGLILPLEGNKINKNTNSAINWEILKIMIIIEIFVIIDQFVEGSSKVSSIIGISKCSGIYWIFFFGFSGLLIYLVFIFKQRIECSDKETKMPQELYSKLNIIIMYSTLAGIVSSMLGIGGGLILNPLMMELKIHPKTITSTSNMMIIFSSSTATILFLMTGQIDFNYGVPLAVICSIFAYYGGTELNKYIKRTNKVSILLFLLFYLQMFSFFVIPIQGYFSSIYESNNGLSIFKFKNFC